MSAYNIICIKHTKHHQTRLSSFADIMPPPPSLLHRANVTLRDATRSKVLALRATRVPNNFAVYDDDESSNGVGN